MKTPKNWIALLACLIFLNKVAGQPAPFQISLEPAMISEMPALQSFAWGQDNGKWLLIGGRVDGLHRRQPGVSFDSLGHHRNLVVVDPASRRRWTAALETLPESIQAQLSATNFEFHQSGKYLYIVGGYGLRTSTGNHTTFGYLTAVDVPAVIDAVVNGRELQPFFRQISDSLFAVTGGQLERIDESYYLVGGQDFEGLYNPMGPTHGPGFHQTYLHRVLRFNVMDDGVNLQVRHFPSAEDTLNLHRRDYNMVPQMMPNGSEGLTAFSGVFQYDANVPWYNCVDIDVEGHHSIAGFQQYYNHYHCPKVALYSARANEMHTLFFGGIAAYYADKGTMTFDRDAPFVKTISRITRTGDGQMREYKLPVEMPAYLGASAEFIPNPALERFPNGVLNLDAIDGDHVLLGHILGGIESKDDNIFWVNDGRQSKASNKVYRVYLDKNKAGIADVFNTLSTNQLQLQVLPSPTMGMLYLVFTDTNGEPVTIELWKGNRNILPVTTLTGLKAGPQHWESACEAFKKGGIFMLQVTSGSDVAKIRLVVEL